MIVTETDDTICPFCDEPVDDLDEHVVTHHGYD